MNQEENLFNFTFTSRTSNFRKIRRLKQAINYSLRRRRIDEIRCENGRPDTELDPSWIPEWGRRTRHVWLQPFADLNEWTPILEWNVNDHDNSFFEDEDENPPWHVWYIQRPEVNLEPGSYSF